MQIIDFMCRAHSVAAIVVSLGLNAESELAWKKMSSPVIDRLLEAMYGLVVELPFLHAFCAAESASDAFIYGGMLRDLAGWLHTHEGLPTWSDMRSIISDVDISTARFIAFDEIVQLAGVPVRRSMGPGANINYVVVIDGLKFEIHCCHQITSLDYTCNTLAYRWLATGGTIFSTQSFLPIAEPYALEDLIAQCSAKLLIPSAQYYHAAQSRLVKMRSKGFALTVEPWQKKELFLPTDFACGLISLLCDVHLSRESLKLADNSNH
jgi:hypothetical protein